MKFWGRFVCWLILLFAVIAQYTIQILITTTLELSIDWVYFHRKFDIHIHTISWLNTGVRSCLLIYRIYYQFVCCRYIEFIIYFAVTCISFCIDVQNQLYLQEKNWFFFLQKIVIFQLIANSKKQKKREEKKTFAWRWFWCLDQ